jgi:hypothetical protein
VATTQLAVGAGRPCAVPFSGGTAVGWAPRRAGPGPLQGQGPLQGVYSHCNRCGASSRLAGGITSNFRTGYRRGSSAARSRHTGPEVPMAALSTPRGGAPAGNPESCCCGTWPHWHLAKVPAYTTVQLQAFSYCYSLALSGRMPESQPGLDLAHRKKQVFDTSSQCNSSARLCGDWQGPRPGAR